MLKNSFQLRTEISMRASMCTKGQVSQVMRQRRIVRSLPARRYGISLADLAADVEASPRNVCSVLDVFRGVGSPLEGAKKVCEAGSVDSLRSTRDASRPRDAYRANADSPLARSLTECH